MSYWTGRFESKHRVAKMCAESVKNVNNITKTVSERQQMRAVSVYYHGMFNSEPLLLPDIVLTKNQITDTQSFSIEVLKMFMSDSDLICDKIFVHNTHYSTGDLVVLEVEDIDNIVVGLVQTLLVKKDKVYFVVQKYEAKRTYLQYFESMGFDPVSCFIESSTIHDYKPLIKRGTSTKFAFVLHHHLSFQYK